jgi:hypothetical protein
MVLPKFIITIDGYLRLGMVNQHKELLIGDDDDDYHEDFNVSDELNIEYYE